MTTVKVEARGWIFLLQLFPLSADLAKSHFFNLPSSSSPPSPHFLWTVTRKPFWAPRLQPLANTSIDHLLTNDWKLDWKHISHLRINVWIYGWQNFWVANSYTLQAVLEQTLMSRGTPHPTNHIRRGFCIRVFQINENNEFYAFFWNNRDNVNFIELCHFEGHIVWAIAVANPSWQDPQERRLVASLKLFSTTETISCLSNPTQPSSSVTLESSKI